MLLGLDLATRTGWCVGDGSGLPRIGHVILPAGMHGDLGPKFAGFRRFLLAMLAEHKPKLVMFEAPILPRYTNLRTTRVLQGLPAIVELECHDAGVACEEAQVSALKRELAGTGKAKKVDMVRVARKVGLDPKVDDEADAFAAWLIAVRHHARQYQREWDTRIWSQGRDALL